MKQYALATLRCPIGGGPLVLHAFRERQLELGHLDVERCHRLGIDAAEARHAVEEGVLLSEAGIWYPIVNFVPVLLDYATPIHTEFGERHKGSPPLQSHQPPNGMPRQGELWVQRSSTTQWNLLGVDTISFGYSAQARDEFIRLELDWPEHLLERPLQVLEVGCGSGFESASLERVTGGAIFGYDLNLALLGKGHHLAELPFVNDGIASLFALPVPPKHFDLVYSNGVLHHTHSTREAFDAIVPYTKPGGTVYIWLYSNEDYDRSIAQRVNWTVEEIARPRIARLPGRVQRVAVRALARRHYRTYIDKGTLGHPEWTYEDSEHFVRGRWTPLYAHRHSFKEVIGWFRRMRMDYRLIDPTAYVERLGVPLIGVGIRGVVPEPSPLGDGSSGRRQILMLASDPASSRRLATAATALAADGWEVEIAGPDDVVQRLDVPPAVTTSVTSSRALPSELPEPGTLPLFRRMPWDRIAPHHYQLLAHALAHPANVIAAFDLLSLPAAASAATLNVAYLAYDIGESFADRDAFREDDRYSVLLDLERLLVPQVDLATAASQSLVEVLAIRCATDLPELVLDTTDRMPAAAAERRAVGTPAPGEGKDARTVLIIPTDDAGAQLAAEALAELNGTSLRVVLARQGDVSELVALAGQLDLVVIVERNSGFQHYWSLPPALIAALGAGLPVIVAGRGGNTDFVEREGVGTVSELSAPALVAALRALEGSQLDAWRAAASAVAPHFMHEHQAERLTVLYGRLHNRPPRSMDAEVAATTRARGAMFAQHHSDLLGVEHGLTTVPGSALVAEITRRLGRSVRRAIIASTTRDLLAPLASAARRRIGP